MTENEIEQHVERLFNALDRKLMSGQLMQAEYDRQATQIAAWAEEQYKGAPGGGDHRICCIERGSVPG